MLLKGRLQPNIYLLYVSSDVFIHVSQAKAKHEKKQSSKNETAQDKFHDDSREQMDRHDRID